MSTCVCARTCLHAYFWEDDGNWIWSLTLPACSDQPLYCSEDIQCEPLVSKQKHIVANSMINSENVWTIRLVNHVPLTLAGFQQQQRKQGMFWVSECVMRIKWSQLLLCKSKWYARIASWLHYTSWVFTLPKKGTRWCSQRENISMSFTITISLWFSSKMALFRMSGEEEVRETSGTIVLPNSRLQLCMHNEFSLLAISICRDTGCHEESVK